MTPDGKEGPKPVPPSPEQGPEKRRETITGIRGALDALKAQVEAKGEGEEREKRVNASLGNLLNIIRQAREAHRGVTNNRAWANLETALTNNVDLRNIDDLCSALIDVPGKQQRELIHLSDEIEATDRYLATFGNVQVERIWGQLTTFLDQRITPQLRERMAKWGVTLDDVRNCVGSIIASLFEKATTILPNLAQVSGGLRWRIALSEAQKDPELRNYLERPDMFERIQKNWQEHYRLHIRRKQSALRARASFDEPVPTIHDALQPPSVAEKPGEKSPDKPAAKELFGVKGLEQGKEFKLEKPAEIRLPEGKLVTLSKETVRLGGREFKFRVDGKPAETSGIIPRGDQARQIEVRFPQEKNVLLGDVVEKIEVSKPDAKEIEVQPGIKLEAAAK